MSLDNFKHIDGRKGYLVETEDRNIFEKEIGRSNFGLGCADMVEFVLYDSNDNVLPQGDSGKKVRYISVDDENSKKYFMNIPSNTFNKKSNDASEFVVDIESLIKDAGYNNGIFKTQITLLNRRAGDEQLEDNKLWIHEISPSRTEIRVLPVRAKKQNEDLELRYKNFTDEKNFRDDLIYVVKKYINSFDFERVFKRFLSSKGRISEGRDYIKLIQLEFKIPNFESWLSNINNKWVESMNYYIDGKVWDVSSPRYGQSTGEKISCIELDIKRLQDDSMTSLLNIININLPKRDVQKDNILSPEEQLSFDEVKNILKTSTSNQSFTSTVPDEIEGAVRGCTDPEAENFNPAATENDGTCKYKAVDAIDPVVIEGCTDPSAENYNPKATKDNGTCKYKVKDEEPPVQMVSKKYYVWSRYGNAIYKDLTGGTRTLRGKEYDSFTISHQIGTFSPDSNSDIREIPKIKPDPIVEEKSTCSYILRNVTYAGTIQRPEPIAYSAYDTGYRGFGGENFSGGITGGRPYAGGRAYDEFPWDSPVERGQNISVRYKDASGNTKSTSVISPGSSITICAEEGSVAPTAGINIVKAGACGVVAPQDPPIRVTPPVQPIPTPTRGGGGGGSIGGGGSRGVFDEIEEESINPYTNPGDRFDRGIFTENIR